MDKIILIEAGSTKSTVLYSSLNGVDHFNISGYNPNRPDPHFFNQFKALNLIEADHLYFYGSGCASKIHQQTIQSYFLKEFGFNATVEGDLIGAARASLGNRKGLCAILGTGGVAAYYDGEKIVQQCGGYGYLINDVGGGFELGKKIVSAWLNKSFSEELDLLISHSLESDKTEFISSFYADLRHHNVNKKLGQIAGLCNLIENIKNDEYLDDLLNNYFDQFFEEHIHPILKNTSDRNLALVGSIAEKFKSYIANSALKHGIKIESIIQYPAESLLNYHLKQQKTEN